MSHAIVDIQVPLFLHEKELCAAACQLCAMQALGALSVLTSLQYFYGLLQSHIQAQVGMSIRQAAPARLRTLCKRALVAVPRWRPAVSERAVDMPTMSRKQGMTKSAKCRPFHCACAIHSGTFPTWLTNSISATVHPRTMSRHLSLHAKILAWPEEPSGSTNEIGLG